MATRHQVRQAIVSLLYANDLNEKDDGFVLEFLKEKKIKNEQKAFTLKLYEGIFKHLSNIDEIINSLLNEGEINNIATVDRAILRLGAYELLYTDTQEAIIINEAVELAKELSSENSPKLVNAILDSISKNKMA
ncbi:transcription antitermination factor NusB [uncultured Campylobacter sp.]|uniref:transcription antitermination factor NusB n=1 Tax=uncultured Campylobacter sp. TaxID=218934 RepID=UPI00261A46E1|nr:transcription antitermination factor NusB [uncultured Campylobacter sp.]